MKLQKFPASLNSFLILASSLTGHASAAITLDLVFDNDNLDLNNTGTFSISGSTTSSSGTSMSWISQSGTGPTSLMMSSSKLSFEVTSLTNVPTLAYNSSTVSQTMDGTSFLKFDGGAGLPNNALEIFGPNTASPTNQLFEIGNGTTDAITGTFTISQSSGLGALTLADLNQSFGSDPSSNPNVNMSASAVPEPSSLSLLALSSLLVFRRKK